MSLKSIVIFTTITGIVLLLFWLNGSDKAGSPTQLSTSEISQPDEITSQSTRQIDVNPSLNTSTPSKLTDTESDFSACLSDSAYSELEQNAQVRDWIFVNTGYEKLDAENYMDIDTLEQQAQSGNSYAMFVLGRHYLYRSHNALPYDPNVFPESEGAQSLQRETPINLNELNKAEYWLSMAGFNGILGAFHELTSVYVLKWQYAAVEKGQQEEKAAPLLIKANAYFYLPQWLLPEYFRGPAYFNRPELSEQQRIDLENALDGLKAMWQQERENLGLPAKLNIEVPDLVNDYINAQLCRAGVDIDSKTHLAND